LQAFGKKLVRNRIILADAQDPGVKALIEIEISLMPIHFPRSDRGKGCREEGHN